MKGVGVLGATSLVGSYLLQQLKDAGHPVTAFTRGELPTPALGIEWLDLKDTHSKTNPIQVRSEDSRTLPLWICAAPIWVLQEYFELMLVSGVKRLVAISSTSVTTKANSSDAQEQAVSKRLASAEDRVKAWATGYDIEVVLLQPTLIYGDGRDKNIAEIARFISKWNFFPIFGSAMGLRHPVHAQDVAAACYASLINSRLPNRSYQISGGEVLPYREMVNRVFQAMGRKPRLISIPLFLFKIAIAFLKQLPRFRRWTPAMAERMNRDLVFDHHEATRDFGFNPRPFVLSAEDVST